MQINEDFLPLVISHKGNKKYINDDSIYHEGEVLKDVINANAKIKSEGLTFTNPEKFKESFAVSVKIGRLVFIIGHFIPNTKVNGELINLKYKPIDSDGFWGTLHAADLGTNSHCYVNGNRNTPCLFAYKELEANARYWIDIKYITNE